MTGPDRSPLTVDDARALLARWWSTYQRSGTPIDAVTWASWRGLLVGTPRCVAERAHERITRLERFMPTPGAWAAYAREAARFFEGAWTPEVTGPKVSKVEAAAHLAAARAALDDARRNRTQPLDRTQTND